MYDDLAQIYVMGVAAAYIVLFVLLAIYFVRSGLRNRKKSRHLRPQPPSSPAANP